MDRGRKRRRVCYPTQAQLCQGNRHTGTVTQLNTGKREDGALFGTQWLSIVIAFVGSTFRLFLSI